ncbi:hypothetical protein DY000_02039372 [Brassica cretica]|uniref:Legume lectin domain-containing protein n=1 Tax=Brassica cretica TaxID=69181 RepID=A0ABQ7BES7_BRACR|nr:hypothetical protein DY000_02039372 [Brassica cretica]
MTNDNNTPIDTTNVTTTPLNVAATDGTVTTAGTNTTSTAAATTTTTLPVGNAADETTFRSLFGAGLYQTGSVSGTASASVFFDWDCSGGLLRVDLHPPSSYSARIALLRLLVTDRSLAVTRHGSPSRSYSAWIALSQSLGLLASLEHEVIPRRHVHPWRFDCDGSLMANTVLTDRSRNHPGVRSVIGIRSMSMTTRPRRSVQSLRLLASLEHDVIPRRHVHPWRFDCDGSLMANTVLTDRSRNHPGVRSVIGIRSMSMTTRPRRSVYGTSSMAT